MPPKKKGAAPKKPPPVVLKPGEKFKPKKIPPPPPCFTPEDLAAFKEVFKQFDDDTDKVFTKYIAIMLRKLGFNPKTAEVEEMCKIFLEDELVDTIELHEWYQMIEAKVNWGDDFEHAVMSSAAILGHDEEDTGVVDFEVFREEIQTWGEPFLEIEFADWLKLATKDKTYNPMDRTFNYKKFIENMNEKDTRYFKEPINFFKLDQKTLAMLAIAKAEKEREEQRKKDEEKKAKAEARRQKMIAAGLLTPSAAELQQQEEQQRLEQQQQETQ